MYGKCLSSEISLSKITPTSSYVLWKETDKLISSDIEQADILNHMASFYLGVLKWPFLKVTRNASTFWLLKY